LQKAVAIAAKIELKMIGFGLARLLSALFSCIAVVDGAGMGVDVGVPLAWDKKRSVFECGHGHGHGCKKHHMK
jgi:hypothetical protein